MDRAIGARSMRGRVGGGTRGDLPTAAPGAAAAPSGASVFGSGNITMPQPRLPSERPRGGPRGRPRSDRRARVAAAMHDFPLRGRGFALDWADDGRERGAGAGVVGGDAVVGVGLALRSPPLPTASPPGGGRKLGQAASLPGGENWRWAAASPGEGGAFGEVRAAVPPLPAASPPRGGRKLGAAASSPERGENWGGGSFPERGEN